MKDPSKYLEGVLLGARKAPELINLLNLEASFPHNVLKRFLTPFGASADALGLAKTAEIDCQVCVGGRVCECVCVCARAGVGVWVRGGGAHACARAWERRV